jgi:glycosyltransferase involved in cell wall biosynthesis
VNPKITVAVIHNRIGGMDVLFSGLEAQTFRDFELVLVDSLYARRKGVLPPTHFPITHVPGLNVEGNVPICRAFNTAMAYARGEIIVFLSDYARLMPNALLTHVQHHACVPNSSMIGALNYSAQPPLNPSLPNLYGYNELGYDSCNGKLPPGATDATARDHLLGKWFTRYWTDFAAGTLDPYLYSVYATPITPSTGIAYAGGYWFDESRHVYDGEALAVHTSLKHNSFRLDDIIKVNGFNEILDGSHNAQDGEFAGRLQTRLGTKFYLDRRAQAVYYDPHGIVTCRDMRRPETTNNTHYAQAQGAGFPLPTGFDLAAVRRQIHGQA